MRIRLLTEYTREYTDVYFYIWLWIGILIRLFGLWPVLTIFCSNSEKKDNFRNFVPLDAVVINRTHVHQQQYRPHQINAVSDAVVVLHITVRRMASAWYSVQ